MTTLIWNDCYALLFFLWCILSLASLSVLPPFDHHRRLLFMPPVFCFRVGESVSSVPFRLPFTLTHNRPPLRPTLHVQLSIYVPLSIFTVCCYIFAPYVYILISCIPGLQLTLPQRRYAPRYIHIVLYSLRSRNADPVPVLLCAECYRIRIVVAN